MSHTCTCIPQTQICISLRSALPSPDKIDGTAQRHRTGFGFKQSLFGSGLRQQPPNRHRLHLYLFHFAINTTRTICFSFLRHQVFVRVNCLLGKSCSLEQDIQNIQCVRGPRDYFLFGIVSVYQHTNKRHLGVFFCGSCSFLAEFYSCVFQRLMHQFTKRTRDKRT